MEAPRSLDEAKAKLASEKNKIITASKSVIGSRVALAVLAMLTIAFAAHLAYAPERLPPLGGFGLTTVGLPPLDFGEITGIARDARDAAVREDVGGSVQGFINENRNLVPIFNGIGFGACFILLIWNLVINTREKKFRGSFIDKPE